MTLIETQRAIEEPTVWEAADFSDPASYSYRLSGEMVEEISRASDRLVSAGRHAHQISRDDFVLPKTTQLLKKIYRDLEDGRGFALLRGWPVDAHSYEHNVAAYCGITAHLGEIVVQNYEGESVVDVKDDRIPYSHESRGYRSNKLLPFHSDGADMVGLLCIDRAARGGLSVIASATRVFNTILDERPEYLDMLLRGFYHHRRRQHPPGENPLSDAPIPVFAFNNGFLHCCYNRNPIDWVEREGKKLSPREIEVLDYFDSVVERPENHVSMSFEPGDIQYLNNFVVLHSRTEFQDDDEHRRHLVRLWLENSGSKRMGKSLLDLYVPGASRYAAAH